MYCFIAYNNKNVATVVEQSKKEVKMELQATDAITGENKYLPGKYAIKKVQILPDEEFTFKTIELKKRVHKNVKI